MPLDVASMAVGEGNSDFSSLEHRTDKNRHTFYCFTKFNFENEEDKFKAILASYCKKYFYGRETCPSTGRKHLQGFCHLKKPMRISELTSLGCNLRPCKGSEEQNINYCSKDGDIVNYGFDIKPKIKIINELRPFQKSLEKILTGDVVEGRINWVYDKLGQIGKTDLLRYMFVTHKVPFAYGGKCSDIMNLVYNNKDYFLSTDKGGMIFNFARDTKMKEVSYRALEQVSDGAIFNSKFEAGCFVCNKPNVVVLSNGLPLMEKLTGSRWKIWEIDDGFNLVEYFDEDD